METARFGLTPFYECLDTIIPLTQLRISNNIPDVKPGRYIGNQMIEFSLQFDHSYLLSESKKHKSNKFDIRAIIRFSNIDKINKVDDQYALKDCFPIHLKLNLNNTVITLPQFLPNDRSGKDGRRFPRPIDLSEGLLDNPLVLNKFLIQWVQDDCKKEAFYFAIYLVRRRTCEELTSVLLKKQLLPIKNTLNFIMEQSNNQNNSQDDDLLLVNTAVNTSLICPVSRVRMTTPVRGQQCTHIQCFDCITYLIMNFNKPTWKCPVCDKKTFFCYLEVDSLILNIINDVRSKSLNSLIFNKHGQWKPENKIPGVSSDEEAYNDISSYFNQNEEVDNVKSSFHTRNEIPSESQEEKYLQQILKSTNRASLMNRFCSPNNLNHRFPVLQNVTVPNRANLINPLFSDGPIRVAFTHGCIQPGNPSFNSPATFQDNFRHVPPVNANSNQQNSNLRFKMETKFADPLSSYFASRNNNQAISQKLKQKTVLSDNSSHIKITNVTSVAKNPTNSRDIIVISDDEADDIPAPSDKDSTANIFIRALKRPTTVSSVPHSVSSAKCQKLSDNCGGQFPMRTSAASAPSVLDSQRMDCCCTSNNMCAAHREMLLRSRMSMNACSVGVPNEPKHMKFLDAELSRANVPTESIPKTVPYNNHIPNGNRLLEHQAAAMNLNKTSFHNGEIHDYIGTNKNTVKEFLKSLQCRPEKIYNGMKNPVNPATPFMIQHQRQLDPLRSIPPEYLQQQWMNMMVSSSQPYPIPQSLFNPPSQFNQTNSIPRENINSFINQSNTFYNC